jgi:hypothetical protein
MVMTDAANDLRTHAAVSVERAIYLNFDFIRLIAASAVVFSHTFLR